LAVAVPPAWSVAATVKVSVPAAVGVPPTASVLVPLAGTLRPATAFWTLLTTRLTVPVPLLAVIAWLYGTLAVPAGSVVGLRVTAGLTVIVGGVVAGGVGGGVAGGVAGGVVGGVVEVMGVGVGEGG
jgi:hypothetical protein